MSALRLVTGQDVTRVTAVARSTTDTLPAPDTVSALLHMSDGSVTALTVSFACIVRQFVLRVVCQGGIVEIERGEDQVCGLLLFLAVSCL